MITTKMKIIAFWSYDIFPYCLWGELTKVTDKNFYVRGYDGFSFSNGARIAFLPEAVAKPVIAKLEKLKADKEASDSKFKSEAKKLLNSL